MLISSRRTSAGDVSVKHWCSTERNPCRQYCAIMRRLSLKTNHPCFVRSVTSYVIQWVDVPLAGFGHQTASYIREAPAQKAMPFFHPSFVSMDGLTALNHPVICIPSQSSRAGGSCQLSDQWHGRPVRGLNMGSSQGDFLFLTINIPKAKTLIWERWWEFLLCCMACQWENVVFSLDIISDPESKSALCQSGGWGPLGPQGHNLEEFLISGL